MSTGTNGFRYFDEAAEQAVLGSLFHEHVFADMATDIVPGYFSEPWSFVFQAIADVAIEGRPVIFNTVGKLLSERGHMEKLGGTHALSHMITEGTEQVAIAREHLRSIAEKYRHRELVRVTEDLHKRTLAGEGYGPFDEAMRQMEKLRDSASNRPVVRPLMDIAPGTPDPQKNVLGDRFLCVAGSMLNVGPSGIGKSSSSVQQDVLWSLGRPAFGIRPARPLRILTVQAENDDEDLAEMRDGVCRGLHLSSADREAVRSRVFYYSESERTGQRFLALVSDLLKAERYDLLRIDPFLGYLGADVGRQEFTSPFLRNGLNPLLAKYGVACILNHHTPKVTNRDTSGWRGSDWMYAGAGSADVTNWARAAMVIDPTHSDHVFRFIAAKRGGRIGWVNEDGERQTVRYYCHASDGLYWREATDEDIQSVETAKKAKKSGKCVKTHEDMKALVPTTGAIPKKSLLAKARENGFSKHEADKTLGEMIDQEKVFVWRIKRSGTNAEVRISRHEQELSEVAE